jgi:EAL domain-containing protein (putative c-di-GMP-specific phosphodiesterase class I)
MSALSLPATSTMVSLGANLLLLLVATASVWWAVVVRRRMSELCRSDGSSAASHMAARHRVADAIEHRRVHIALQPIIDLTTGRLAGAEALARFADGRPPDEWFGEATETGQVLDLDALTFASAVGLLRTLPEHCYLSVNASPELVMRGDLVRRLDEQRVPLDRLVIEVTEHVKVSSYSDLHTRLAVLRERGVRLAIDDTGAGYASFNHVLQLKPDIIKIDRSLIVDITDDAARRSLVTALVLLALDLDASITAEGVETASELETLATLGVDCAQGYLLARPSTDRSRWAAWTDPGRVWDAGQAHIDSGRSVSLPGRPLV